MNSSELISIKIKDASKENPGIYYILCITNQKIYIGSSKRPKRRWYEHSSYFSRSKHANQHMQSCYNKYGKDAMVFGMLENCAKEELDIRENHYISLIDKELRLNLASPTRNGEISEETRQLLSLINKGRKFGPLSDEHRLKVSLSLKGRKFSDETKKKMSISGKLVKNHPNYKSSNYKLTYEQVLEIKKLLKRSFLLNREIASIYNINPRTVASINQKISWSQVPDPENLELSLELAEKELQLNPNLVNTKFRKTPACKVSYIKKELASGRSIESLLSFYGISKTEFEEMKRGKMWNKVNL